MSPLDLDLDLPHAALDAEGFLVDELAWTPALAEELARASGLARLTPGHWKIVICCREASARDGRAPSIATLSRLAGISLAELQNLFPMPTASLVARIAGLPRPLLPAADSWKHPLEENKGVVR